jgi:putative RecB family exonuclease
MVLSELRQQPHLSASSIGDMSNARSYKFGRIDRLPMEFKSEALEFGTCIHRVLEQFYYSAKMIGEKMLLKDVHQIFETTGQALPRIGTISATAVTTISNPC